MIKKLKKKIKKSYFIVNKLYLLFIFILLSISNFAAGFIYFLITSYIYFKKILTSSIPMEVNEKIDVYTYLYKHTDSSDLYMDIYYPNKTKNKYPLVYFCHGGGWISGFRDQPNNVSWCRFLASKGFVVASIDYRYGYKNTMLDLLSDYKDGLNYIRKNSQKLSIDIESITLMGLSAGAHMSLLYSTYGTNIKSKELMKGIQSVIAYYPPTNLNDLNKDENKSLISKFGVRQTIKDSPSDIDDPYLYYSPCQWVSSNMIPTLLVHGKKDDVVPFKSSVDFARKLKYYNIEYDFLVHNKAGHTFDTSLSDYNTIHIIEKTVRFINKYKKE